MMTSTQKTDDEILEQARRLMGKVGKDLNLWQYVPDWVKQSPETAQDEKSWMSWIPGAGAKTSWLTGKSMVDKEQRITPEMMDVIQRKHPEID